jgi:hypothetical protein
MSEEYKNGYRDGLTDAHEYARIEGAAPSPIVDPTGQQVSETAKCKWCQREVLLRRGWWTAPQHKSGVCPANPIGTWHEPAEPVAVPPAPTPAIRELNELQRVLDSPSFLWPQDKPLVRILVGNVRAALGGKRA